MSLPVQYDSVELRGKYVDLAGNPVRGYLIFTPSVNALTAPDALTMIVGRPLQVDLSNLGTFSISLPATDDPDITPDGWAYTVEEHFVGLIGRTYTIVVPVQSAGDGIDLSTVAPAVNNGPVTVYQVFLDGGAPDSTYPGTTDGGTS